MRRAERAMAQIQRPLSPHLQIYRWYLTMALSIAHRVSGVANVFALIILTWWLVALASGPAAFAGMQGVSGAWFGTLLLFLYTPVLFYHMGNGVRHLVWDVGYGFDPDVAYKSSLAVLAFAGVMTVLTWIVVVAAG
jgi:succinate dehydrogenase / fumarate reductase, cytochrome b subunit